jgi:Circularly permutated YpsA SLOG family
MNAAILSAAGAIAIVPVTVAATLIASRNFRRTTNQATDTLSRQVDNQLLLHIHAFLSDSVLMDARRLLRENASQLRDNGHLLNGEPLRTAADRVAASYDQAGLLLHTDSASDATRDVFLSSSWGLRLVAQYKLLEAPFLNEKLFDDRTGRQYFCHFVFMALEAELRQTQTDGHRRIIQIRSGGQTGVDRAALDFARLKGLACSGWCPSSGWAEDIPIGSSIRDRYPELIETPLRNPMQRTEWNVRDSTATVIVQPSSSKSDGTAQTIAFATAMSRPHIVIGSFDVVETHRLREFLKELPYGSTLNIAGPRISERPDCYERTRAMLDDPFEFVD